MALPEIITTINTAGHDLVGYSWPFFWTLAKILCVTLPLMGLVAYLTL